MNKEMKKRGGWKLSAETKRKIGEASCKRIWKRESREKLSVFHKGKHIWKTHPRGMLGKISWNKGNLLLEEKVCANCSEKFFGKPSAFRKLCSRKCSNMFRSGKNSALWKGGLTLHSSYYSHIQKNREIKKKGNGGTHTILEWEELKKKFGYMCLCCKRMEPEIKLTKDHIIPIYQDGTNDISNLQPLCPPCNSRKRVKVIDFRKEIIALKAELA